jgi:hypothetical protein
MKELTVLLLTAKAGFLEVPAHMVPEKARAEFARSIRSNQAVSFWMNPNTGQVRAVVQDENDRENVRVLTWSGR